MPLLPSTSRSSRARGLKHGLRHGERVDLPSRSSRARGLKRFVVEQVPQPLRSRSLRAGGFAAYDAKDAQVGVYSTAEEAIAALAGHPGPAKREGHDPSVNADTV
jgi:hypothetical protein